MTTIDLRSDTVTKPTRPMLDAMLNAPLGDDVYGEDPTVNLLEEAAADMLGKEAAIFCPSGTQSNLLALLTHCQRGDEYIVGQKAHTYMYEAGGGAVLGSIQPQPLDFQKDGTLDLEQVAQTIKPDDYHFAKTRLLCLENTQWGKVLPMDYLKKAKALTDKEGLGIHLDGARIFNAAVKLDIHVKDISQYFDTVSFCLSKGLGTPVGSLLCGNKDQIHAARRWRKMLGGGMRQAGILAAAGIYALNHHVDRLADDHDNGRFLAEALNQIDGISVDKDLVQTNILMMEVEQDFDSLFSHLNNNGILIPNQNPARLVTHLDVTREDVLKVIQLIQAFKD